MKSLHESHIGVEGTLRRARDIVYWPGIMAQLKDYLSKCGICNRYWPEQCREPLQPHIVPNLPWEKVGGDLFILERQSFLIAIDYYSGYFDILRYKIWVTPQAIVSLQLKRLGLPDMASLWQLLVTTDRLSTVEILSRSVKNGTFITLLQALAIPRVMVVLEMPWSPASRCWWKPVQISEILCWRYLNGATHLLRECMLHLLSYSMAGEHGLVSQ